MGKRDYQNEAMEGLAAQLIAGLRRLRKGSVDAAAALIQIIDPRAEYPYEFVVYRLTGYRPRGGVEGEPMSGESVRADLLKLMLDLCDSFELRTSDYPEAVYDTRALCRRLNVSSKTVQRWRRRGLPARRLIFPDGRRRNAFLESEVRRFTEGRPRQIDRSRRFSQMSEVEREELVRRARRLASGKPARLNDVARRLARRMGRSVEAVRYTIRRHDRENPDDAVFPDHPSPLGDPDKQAIYREYLHGASATALAKRFGRTRGSIYRIVNEVRAAQILGREINYVYNPQFDDEKADEIILTGDDPERPASEPRPRTTPPKAPPGLPAYLRALYDVPLLTAEQELDLFRKYNYLKFKADRLRQRLDPNRLRNDDLRTIEGVLLRANVVKNRLVRANLRLVVSIAKKHLDGPQNLFELISDGNVTLMQAVEKFDYARGNRFSTYASWAIMRNFARSVPRERSQLSRFSTGHEETLDLILALRTDDSDEVHITELRESIDTVLTQLTPRERTIVTGHYGLDEQGSVYTFEQLGQVLGISKERVRQIEIGALGKLRRTLDASRADLLS